MKNLIHTIKRFFYTRVFILFNLSAVAFTFQACYGTPQDFEIESEISGIITAADTQSPVVGIEVRVDSWDYAVQSDENGAYTIYARPDSVITLNFLDVDSSANGSFQNKTARLVNPEFRSQIQYDVSLTRKED